MVHRLVPVSYTHLQIALLHRVGDILIVGLVDHAVELGFRLLLQVLQLADVAVDSGIHLILRSSGAAGGMAAAGGLTAGRMAAGSRRGRGHRAVSYTHLYSIYSRHIFFLLHRFIFHPFILSAPPISRTTSFILP